MSVGSFAVQAACVDPAAAGRDVLAVTPTGGGKSAIHQLAAAVVPGITVVAVPLLALATDQQRGLAETSLPPAVEINGSTDASERRALVEKLRSGEAEYLFITPDSDGPRATPRVGGSTRRGAAADTREHRASVGSVA